MSGWVMRAHSEARYGLIGSCESAYPREVRQAGSSEPTGTDGVSCFGYGEGRRSIILSFRLSSVYLAFNRFLH
jgi:hypothetical protein